MKHIIMSLEEFEKEKQEAGRKGCEIGYSTFVDECLKAIGIDGGTDNTKAGTVIRWILARRHINL